MNQIEQISMYGGMPLREAPTKIVVHPGNAHGDDFFACCVLASKFCAPIERREPTQDDLDDPDILVLDVGGRYEPEKLNFDHHQDLTIPCSFVLVLQWLGLHEKFQRAYRWYENVDFRDRRGVKALGEKYCLTDEQMLELGAPGQTAMMAQFEKLSRLSQLPMGWEHAHDEKARNGEFLYEVMYLIGNDLIDYAEKYDAAWERLKKDEHLNLRSYCGYWIYYNHSDDITATGDYIREKKIAVMASHDNRGSGWAILRTNEGEKAFDFNRVANDPRIAFAHKGGFIAKTRERVAVGEIFDLIKKAFVA